MSNPIKINRTDPVLTPNPPLTMWDDPIPVTQEPASDTTAEKLDQPDNNTSENIGHLDGFNKREVTDLQRFNIIGLQVPPPRLVVVSSINYQPLPGEGESRAFSDGYLQGVINPEQLYERETRFSGTVPLDTGWVKNGKTLIVFNQEGRNLQKIPSPQEIGELNNRVILIYIDPVSCNPIIVLPRQSVMLRLTTMVGVRFEFPQPNTKIKYVVVPE